MHSLQTFPCCHQLFGGGSVFRATFLTTAAILVPTFLPALSLNEALQSTQQEHPALKAAELRYEAALSRVPQAGALPDPRLQITRFVEAIETRTGAQRTQLSLSQGIPWFGKRGARESAAEARARAEWYAFREASLAQAHETARLFFELAHTERAISLLERSRALLEKLEPVVSARVEGGAGLNALLRLQVESGRIEDRLESLRDRGHRFANRLLQQMGRAVGPGSEPPAPEWQPPPSGEPDPTLLRRQLLATHPALLRLQQMTESARFREAIARLERYPDLTVGLNYLQTTRREGVTVADNGADPWGVTVALNLPLWFERDAAARREALHDRSALMAEQESIRQRLLADLGNALSSRADAASRLQRYEGDLLPLARQALEISRTAYQTGRASLLEVIDSERSLLDLELEYWRAAAALWQAHVTLSLLAGQMAWTDVPNNPLPAHP